MGIRGLFRAHPGWSAIGSIAALVSVWGWLGDARDLWTAGVKPEYLQLFGFGAFLFSVVSVVARQQQHLEERLAALASPSVSNPAPASAPAAAPGLTPEHKLEAPQDSAPRRARRPPASASGRIFVADDVTPKSLADLFAGHTDVQGARLTEVFIDKWMCVEGRLQNVLSHFGDTTALFGTEQHGEFRLDALLRLEFSGAQAERVHTIPVGGEMTVIGRIRKIERHAVWLADCELVEADLTGRDRP